MNYQWYPGHMTKARRQMQEDLKLIDLMIELVDARVPAASRNPDIDELGKNKARLILLNKSDLADERGNDAWMEYFKGKGYSVVKVNSRSGAGMKAINSAVQEACKENRARPQTRHPEPSGPRDGCRYSERRKIDIYQCVCGQSLCENRKQTGRHEGKTMDPSEQTAGASGHTWYPVAEV